MHRALDRYIRNEESRKADMERRKAETKSEIVKQVAEQQGKDVIDVPLKHPGEILNKALEQNLIVIVSDCCGAKLASHFVCEEGPTFCTKCGNCTYCGEIIDEGTIHIHKTGDTK